MTLVSVKFTCEVCGAINTTVQKSETKFVPRYCGEHRSEAARKRFNAFTDKTRERGPKKAT